MTRASNPPPSASPQFTRDVTTIERAADARGGLEPATVTEFVARLHSAHPIDPDRTERVAANVVRELQHGKNRPALEASMRTPGRRLGLLEIRTDAADGAETAEAISGRHSAQRQQDLSAVRDAIGSLESASQQGTTSEHDELRAYLGRVGLRKLSEKLHHVAEVMAGRAESETPKPQHEKQPLRRQFETALRCLRDCASLWRERPSDAHYALGGANQNTGQVVLVAISTVFEATRPAGERQDALTPYATRGEESLAHQVPSIGAHSVGSNVRMAIRYDGIGAARASTAYSDALLTVTYHAARADALREPLSDDARRQVAAAATVALDALATLRDAAEKEGSLDDGLPGAIEQEKAALEELAEVPGGLAPAIQYAVHREPDWRNIAWRAAEYASPEDADALQGAVARLVGGSIPAEDAQNVIRAAAHAARNNGRPITTIYDMCQATLRDDFLLATHDMFEAVTDERIGGAARTIVDEAAGNPGAFAAPEQPGQDADDAARAEYGTASQASRRRHDLLNAALGYLARAEPSEESAQTVASFVRVALENPAVLTGGRAAERAISQQLDAAQARVLLEAVPEAPEGWDRRSVHTSLENIVHSAEDRVASPKISRAMDLLDSALVYNRYTRNRDPDRNGRTFERRALRLADSLLGKLPEAEWTTMWSPQGSSSLRTRFRDTLRRLANIVDDARHDKKARPHILAGKIKDTGNETIVAGPGVEPMTVREATHWFAFQAASIGADGPATPSEEDAARFLSHVPPSPRTYEVLRQACPTKVRQRAATALRTAAAMHQALRRVHVPVVHTNFGRSVSDLILSSVRELPGSDPLHQRVGAMLNILEGADDITAEERNRFTELVQGYALHHRIDDPLAYGARRDRVATMMSALKDYMTPPSGEAGQEPADGTSRVASLEELDTFRQAWQQAIADLPEGVGPAAEADARRTHVVLQLHNGSSMTDRHQAWFDAVTDGVFSETAPLRTQPEVVAPDRTEHTGETGRLQDLMTQLKRAPEAENPLEAFAARNEAVIAQLDAIDAAHAFEAFQAAVEAAGDDSEHPEELAAQFLVDWPRSAHARDVLQVAMPRSVAEEIAGHLTGAWTASQNTDRTQTGRWRATMGALRAATGVLPPSDNLQADIAFLVERMPEDVAPKLDRAELLQMVAEQTQQDPARLLVDDIVADALQGKQTRGETP